jgi:hypothetical protein
LLNMLSNNPSASLTRLRAGAEQQHTQRCAALPLLPAVAAACPSQRAARRAHAARTGASMLCALPTRRMELQLTQALALVAATLVIADATAAPSPRLRCGGALAARRMKPLEIELRAAPPAAGGSSPGGDEDTAPADDSSSSWALPIGLCALGIFIACTRPHA